MLHYRIFVTVFFLLCSKDVEAELRTELRCGRKFADGCPDTLSKHLPAATRHSPDNAISLLEGELSQAILHLDRFAELFLSTPELEPPSTVETDPMNVRPVSKVRSLPTPLRRSEEY